MGALTDAVRAFADQHQLWTPATRVAAAVSGGSDSVALLFLLQALASRGYLQLAGLIHLNHHIRGSASDDDAEFCRALADRFGIAAVMGDADVPARAARDGVSIEVAGREARQECFLSARESLGVDCIALAHTRDDQAETVLLRLTRGAGPAGLAGIAASRDHLIRPLLNTSHDELRAYLNERGQAWREDETNLDRAIPRNLIRHEVLPALRRLNPRVDVALARTADILRRDAEWLEHSTREAAAWNRLAR
jgi:tRNA(Ile)-lysidine synthase